MVLTRVFWIRRDDSSVVMVVETSAADTGELLSLLAASVYTPGPSE